MREQVILKAGKSKIISAWIIGAMCVISACGGREAKGQSAIKGLSVGMDIAEVKTVCMDLLKDCVALDNGAVPIISKDQDIGGFDLWEVGVPGGKQVLISAASGISQDPIIAAYGGKKILEGAIGFDASGKVTGFGFSGAMVKYLFGSTEMEASDFVEQFAKSYKIPEFNTADDYSYWYYDSPENIRIKIDSDQKLSVRKVQAKSFN